MKEKIHALTEEMLENMGRLVAIDSQLGTPKEGKPFGEGPAKALEEGLILLTCGTNKNVVRFIAPTIVTEKEIDKAMEILEKIL